MTTASAHARAPRRPLLVLAAAALTALLAMATAGPAWADSITGGGNVGGGQVSGGGSGGTTTGGGGGGTGGGSSGGGGSVVANTTVRTVVTAFPPGQTSLGGISCARLGDGRLPTGFSAVEHLVLSVPNPQWGVTPMTVTDVQCLYPPPPVQRLVVCGWGGQIVVDGPYRNAMGVSPRVPLASQTYATGFQQGDHSPAACAAVMPFSLATHITDFGQYRLVATPTRVNCVETIYVQSTQPPVIGACSAPYVSGQTTVLHQIWCGGSSPDWSGSHSFDQTECVGGQGSPAHCSAPPPVLSWDGAPGTANGGIVQVLDDGVSRLAVWRTPSIVGMTDLHHEASRLVYDSGTPWRHDSSASQDGQTQPVVVGSTGDSSRLGDWNSGWTAQATSQGTSGWLVKFEQAGFPGLPWTAHPEWSALGTVTARITTITSMSITGQVTTSVQPYVIHDVPAICRGLPIKIDVFRARESNG